MAGPAHCATGGTGSGAAIGTGAPLSQSGYVWSILEKIVLRASSAAVTMVLPLVAVPSDLAAYAYALALLFVVLTVTDLSWRQVAAATARSVLAEPSLASLVRILGYGGLAIAAAGTAIMPALGFSTTQVLSVAPLAFVPLITSRSLTVCVHLEQTHQFKKLSLIHI